jgi:hypothetical protein
VLPLGPDDASPSVCRCLSVPPGIVPFPLLFFVLVRGGRPGLFPYSPAPRRLSLGCLCGSSLRLRLFIIELHWPGARASFFVLTTPLSGSGSPWWTVPASAERRCALGRGLPDSRRGLVGCYHH